MCFRFQRFIQDPYIYIYVCVCVCVCVCVHVCVCACVCVCISNTFQWSYGLFSLTQISFACKYISYSFGFRCVFIVLELIDMAQKKQTKNLFSFSGQQKAFPLYIFL